MADLNKRATETDLRLKRLFDAIEIRNGAPGQAKMSNTVSLLLSKLGFALQRPLISSNVNSSFGVVSGRKRE